MEKANGLPEIERVSGEDESPNIQARGRRRSKEERNTLKKKKQERFEWKVGGEKKKKKIQNKQTDGNRGLCFDHAATDNDGTEWLAGHIRGVLVVTQHIVALQLEPPCEEQRRLGERGR